MKKIIGQIEKEARRFFVGSSGCHDWTHVERVRKLVMKIGKKEGADLFVLEVAALLHDIGRKDEMKAKGMFCHALHGGKIAGKILSRYKFKEKIIDDVIHCIEAHRYRNKNKPQSIEAKVLYDADKLDSLGAIGIARIFVFAGNAGSKTLYTGNEKKLAKSKKDYSYTKEDSALLEYEKKIKFIKDKMLTKEGRKVAMKRHDFMEKYFSQFYQEIDGKI